MGRCAFWSSWGRRRRAIWRSTSAPTTSPTIWARPSAPRPFPWSPPWRSPPPSTLQVDIGLSGPALMLVMIAALLAAAAWINLSTFVGAPVSTTHAIIGGMVGAAVTAGGIGAVAWPTIAMIAVTWTISPVLGGVFAAAIHAVIRATITRRADKLAAARTWVPILVAAMTGIFAMYLASKSPGHFWRSTPATTIALGLAFSGLGWLVAAPWVHRRSKVLENRKKQVARLFRPPLIVAAALLSFAHGSNDVANALGPLMA
ncbi:MAG: hypothetical protein B7Z15_17765, partial [Rhizobiales bacterium 32-66-8]